MESVYLIKRLFLLIFLFIFVFIRKKKVNYDFRSKTFQGWYDRCFRIGFVYYHNLINEFYVSYVLNQIILF